MIEQMLFTLFCTVFFCLGFHLVTQDGYILDFISSYFENTNNKILRFIASPLVLCITCMGSIWGVTWFILLNGFSLHVLPYMVINCFASAFIQTFIWKLYAKINI